MKGKIIVQSYITAIVSPGYAKHTLDASVLVFLLITALEVQVHSVSLVPSEGCPPLRLSLILPWKQHPHGLV